jgi:signal peptidase I
MTQPRVEAPDATKIEIATELLRSRQTIRLRALGTSMLPALWPGDLLTIEPCTAPEAATGDIVLMAREARFVIHRLVRQRGEVSGDGSAEWVTRGDALRACDPPARAEDIIGRVASVTRRGRELGPPHRLSLSSQMLAATIAHCDWFRSLVLQGSFIRQKLHTAVLRYWSANGLHASATARLSEE